jgi:hypothetical protein
MLEQLVTIYGVQLLWGWCEEYIELQRIWSDDEQTTLDVWLLARAGLERDRLDQDRVVG